MLDTQTLAAIKDMQVACIKEPNGPYYLEHWLDAQQIELFHGNGHAYVRSREHGDHLLKIRADHQPELLWAELVADNEWYGEADILPGTKLCCGDVFRSLKNVGTETKPKWDIDKYYTVPEGVVCVIRESKREAPGFIVIVSLK